MISRLRRASAPAALLLGSALLTVACQKVPLLAPSGSTITLTALATALPSNGTTQIIAQVIEASGTPPHSGTLITFTTNLGTVQPSEAETDIGGRVTVNFIAGGGSGTATIAAISGGVSASGSNAIKIAIGAAAVSRVTLDASPTSISALGGSSKLSSFVFDTNGNGIGGVPVSFSTDAGTVTPSVATTDSSGKATATLTTNRTAKVTVTAGVASPGSGTGTGATPASSAQTATITVTVNTGPAVSISTTTTNPIVNQPVVFTVTTAAPGTTGSAIKDVTVDFGDGSRGSAGTGSSSTVQHVYRSTGVFTVTAVATDVNGDSSSAQTSVVVSNAPKPTVTVTLPSTTPTANQSSSYTVAGTVSTTGNPNNSIQNMTIDFGDNTGPISLGNSASVTIQHTYPKSTEGKDYPINATITDANGQTGSTSTFVHVNPGS